MQIMEGSPQGTIQLPRALSTLAPQVDWLYYFIFWASVVAFIAIAGSLLYFVWRYRSRPGIVAEPTQDHHTLELFWTFTPLLFLVFLFHEGWIGYVRGAVAPANAIEIRVRAKKWNWEFEYPTGSRSPSELTIPAGRPIKLVMSSDDVLHSFFAREFRVKRDVVPGMYTSLWFEADPNAMAAPYDTDIYCTEYCGTGHSVMLAKIHVVTPEQYETFLVNIDRPPPGKTPAQWGEDLFAQNGCPTCHSVDGVTRSQGPNLRGKFGTVEQFEAGDSALIDESYIRNSILQPQAHIVRGYTAVQMPAFVMNDARLDAIVAYIKSLR